MGECNNMRNAKASDYWNRVNSRKFDKSIDLLCLNGMNGIPDISLGSGVYAICGLNGAGKSTIMLSLKDIFGLQSSGKDIIKLQGKKVEAIITSNKQQQVYSNKDIIKFVELEENKEKVWFIDHDNSINVIKYLSQDNLAELLEQYDQLALEDEDIEDLNYIIGKKYNKVTLINIEDEDGKEIPYFLVESYGIKYDSLKMGIGEHWLFYIWWKVFRTSIDSLALIEEPETFIGIRSQEKLMNFIAKKASEKGISFLLTTHSPFVLKHIKRENISIISRYGNDVDVCKPSENMSILNDLGLEISKKGTIFVEDNVARLFLTVIIQRYDSSILKKYNIEFVGGETYITERLRFPYSKFIDYRFVGLYDGDMKNKVEISKGDDTWKYDFLPTDEPVEVEFKDTMINKIDKLAELTGKVKSELLQVLAKIEGENHHDWYTLFSKETGICLELLTEKLFLLWIEDDSRKEKVQEFEKRLSLLCE